MPLLDLQVRHEEHCLEARLVAQGAGCNQLLDLRIVPKHGPHTAQLLEAGSNTGARPVYGPVVHVLGLQHVRVHRVEVLNQGEQ